MRGEHENQQSEMTRREFLGRLKRWSMVVGTLLVGTAIGPVAGSGCLPFGDGDDTTGTYCNSCGQSYTSTYTYCNYTDYPDACGG